MTGQPVTAAIVVARFHRPFLLIRAVSILFYLCRKGVRSFLVQGEKGILFLYGTFAERELTTNHIFWLFFVWRRKEISPHSFSCCCSDARRRLETQTHAQTHTFDDR